MEAILRATSYDNFKCSAEVIQAVPGAPDRRYKLQATLWAADEHALLVGTKSDQPLNPGEGTVHIIFAEYSQHRPLLEKSLLGKGRLGMWPDDIHRNPVLKIYAKMPKLVELHNRAWDHPA